MSKNSITFLFCHKRFLNSLNFTIISFYFLSFLLSFPLPSKYIGKIFSFSFLSYFPSLPSVQPQPALDISYVEISTTLSCCWSSWRDVSLNGYESLNFVPQFPLNQGRSQNLKLRGAVLLLVACFQLICLTTNEFFFFCVFFMCASRYGQNYFV